MTTTIVKWGNSQGIRLPKNLLETADLSENDTIEIFVKDKEIIIKKASPKNKNFKSITELFADYNGSYEPVEIDYGEPVGREVW